MYRRHKNVHMQARQVVPVSCRCRLITLSCAQSTVTLRSTVPTPPTKVHHHAMMMRASALAVLLGAAVAANLVGTFMNTGAAPHIHTIMLHTTKRSRPLTPAGAAERHPDHTTTAARLVQQRLRLRHQLRRDRQRCGACPARPPRNTPTRPPAILPSPPY